MALPERFLDRVPSVAERGGLLGCLTFVLLAARSLGGATQIASEASLASWLTLRPRAWAKVSWTLNTSH